MGIITSVTQKITVLDRKAIRRAQDRLDGLTKPQHRGIELALELLDVGQAQASERHPALHVPGGTVPGPSAEGDDVLQAVAHQPVFPVDPPHHFAGAEQPRHRGRRRRIDGIAAPGQHLCARRRRGNDAPR